MTTKSCYFVQSYIMIEFEQKKSKAATPIVTVEETRIMGRIWFIK